MAQYPENEATVSINICAFAEGSFDVQLESIIQELEPIDNPKLETVVEEQLLLKSPDLLGNAKWSFHYDGKIIRAAIKDDVFMENVKRSKVKLSAGVRLPVKMLIQVYMNEKLDIERKVYTILEVTGDVIEPTNTDAEQLNLF